MPPNKCHIIPNSRDVFDLEYKRFSYFDRLIFTLKYERCSDGVTLTGDGVTQAELPLVDGEQV